MKGTRLWQDTGSALISGRSRRDKPFWREVVIGWGGSVIAWAVAGAAAGAAEPGGRLVVADKVVTGPWAGVIGYASLAVAPALLGAFLGVWLAKKMGWRRCALTGGIIGGVFALAWFALAWFDVTGTGG